MVLLIISTTIFTLYNLYIWYRYGELPSISASYNKLPEKQKPIFTFILWLFAWPLIFIGIDIFLFLAVAAISAVGVAPDYLISKREEKFHGISAILGVIFASLSLWMFHGIWLVPIIIIVGILLIKLFKVKHYILYIEYLAFYSILAGYYYVLLKA